MCSPSLRDTGSRSIAQQLWTTSSLTKISLPQVRGFTRASVLERAETDDGHSRSNSTVEKFIERNRLPHLLFYGPPGTGKTSTILAMARKIYGPRFRNNVLEVSN